MGDGSDHAGRVYAPACDHGLVPNFGSVLGHYPNFDGYDTWGGICYRLVANGLGVKDAANKAMSAISCAQGQAAVRLTMDRRLTDLGVTPPQFAVMTMLKAYPRPVRRRRRPPHLPDTADRGPDHPQPRTRRGNPESPPSRARPHFAMVADPARRDAAPGLPATGSRRRGAPPRGARRQDRSRHPALARENSSGDAGGLRRVLPGFASKIEADATSGHLQKLFWPKATCDCLSLVCFRPILGRAPRLTPSIPPVRSRKSPCGID